LKAEAPYNSNNGTKGILRLVLITLDFDSSSKPYFSYYDFVNHPKEVVSFKKKKEKLLIYNHLG